MTVTVMYLLGGCTLSDDPLAFIPAHQLTLLKAEVYMKPQSSDLLIQERKVVSAPSNVIETATIPVARSHQQGKESSTKNHTIDIETMLARARTYESTQLSPVVPEPQ